MKRSHIFGIIVSSVIVGISSASFLSSKSSFKEVKAEVIPFNGYYDVIENDPSLTDGENGTLRKALTKLIKPAAYYKYSGSNKGQLGYELQFADEDPNNSENMILFYTQNSIKKTPGTTSGTVNWNREHVWPQSKSAGLYGDTGAGADILHIRPSYASVNSSRGNTIFAELDKSTSTRKVYNQMDYGYMKGDYFMPLDEIKGDVARMSLYLWTEYFSEWPSEAKQTPLTNNFDKIETAIEWHLKDAPSSLEQHRNQVAYEGKQKNRNPFVDHPEYVCRIWGNVNDKTKSLCSNEATVTIKNIPDKININQDIQLEYISSTGEKPTFASSNTKVATVSESGVLRGVMTGTAEITASLGGVVKSSFTVNVTTVVDPGGFNYVTIIVLSTTIPLGIIAIGTTTTVILYQRKKKKINK